MAVNRVDQQNLDTWRGAEGAAQPPPKRSGEQNNLKPMTHGIWANQCLDDQERELFQQIIAKLYQDFEFNRSSDFLQVELMAIYSVKLVRAQINVDVDAAEKLDRMIRCRLKDLKATKIVREGETGGGGPGTSPAEWAKALLEQLTDSSKKPARKPAKRQKTRK